MASDYLLELEGIKGESKDDFKRGNLQLDSWSLGASNPSINGGGNRFSEITVSKKCDKSSPTLMLSCATGKHIPKAVLHVRKSPADTTAFYTVTLTDVLISSYNADASDGDLPSDGISMIFAKIKFDYVLKGTTTSTGELANQGGTP